MAQLGFELIFRFLWGSMLVLTMVSRKETSERFPRIASYIVLGTSAFAAYLASSWPQVEELRSIYLSLLALVLGSLLYALTTSRASRIIGFLLYTLSPIPFLSNAQNFQDILNFITSGLLFGGVFAGQYTGHWFLTVPNLNIRELQRVIKVLFVALGLKTLEVSWTLFKQYQLHKTPFLVDDMGRPLPISGGEDLAKIGNTFLTHGLEGDVFLGLGFYGSLILVSRLLWGILAPWLLVYMTKKTVDMRSTQSATGILYALCVMIILGEGAALYLKKALGWNL